jgi:hypothetical protein
VNANEQTELSSELASQDAGGDMGAHGAPLGSGDFGEGGFDTLSGGAAARKSHNGAFLIAAVVLIAMAGLFSMRKLAQMTAGAGIDREIEATIEKILPTIEKRSEQVDRSNERIILAVLGESYSTRQIPLEEVQRDPFIIHETYDPGTETETPVAVVDPSLVSQRQLREAQERRRLDFEEARRSLVVKAVMAGSRPFAIIDGQTVGVGDAIYIEAYDVTFRIVEIEGDLVQVMAEDLNLELTEDEGTAYRGTLALQRNN